MPLPGSLHRIRLKSDMPLQKLWPCRFVPESRYQKARSIPPMPLGLPALRHWVQSRPLNHSIYLAPHHGYRGRCPGLSSCTNLARYSNGSRQWASHSWSYLPHTRYSRRLPRHPHLSPGYPATAPARHGLGYGFHWYPAILPP